MLKLSLVFPNMSVCLSHIRVFIPSFQDALLYYSFLLSISLHIFHYPHFFLTELYIVFGNYSLLKMFISIEPHIV